jgi:hypothetical protein
METETGKRYPSRIFPQNNAAQIQNPIGPAMDKEAMQMFATPIESSLKDAMEFGETGFVGHEQSPPNQRTDAAEHYAKLIDRSGRYGRFRYANGLTQARTSCLEPDPLDSPALLHLQSIENEACLLCGW